jgi:hypothetical protein
VQKRPLKEQALRILESDYSLAACAAVTAAATEQPDEQIPTNWLGLAHGFAPFEFFDSTGAILTLIILVSNSLTKVATQARLCASRAVIF